MTFKVCTAKMEFQVRGDPLPVIHQMTIVYDECDDWALDMMINEFVNHSLIAPMTKLTITETEKEREVEILC